MPDFEATIRVHEVVDADKAAARRTIEERLRAAGFQHFQIISIAVPSAITPPALAPRQPARGSSRTVAMGGPLLVAAGAAWALWFLWMIAG